MSLKQWSKVKSDTCKGFIGHDLPQVVFTSGSSRTNNKEDIRAFKCDDPNYIKAGVKTPISAPVEDLQVITSFRLVSHFQAVGEIIREI